MMSRVFPFGNDPQRPETWVGRNNTQSQSWLLSYDGSFSIVCGYHSFIFLGLDNLRIGIVNLKNCGVSVALPIGKLFQFAGKSEKIAKRTEKTADRMGDAKSLHDAAKMENEQDRIGEGMQLYQRMEEAIPQRIRAAIPFSFNDLDGMPGAIAGAEVELFAAAAGYYVEGYTGISGDKVFGPSLVANAGDGLVSAGTSLAVGVWSVEKSFDLYSELSNGAHTRCHVDGQNPNYDQPFRVIPSINPYLAALPPAGCPLSETGFSARNLLP